MGPMWHRMTMALFVIMVVSVDANEPIRVKLHLEAIATSNGEMYGSGCVVYVGTPPQRFTLGLDGGFPYTLLNGQKCDDPSVCASGPRYMGSNTSVGPSGDFSAQYGFGLFTATGELYQDQFSFDLSAANNSGAWLDQFVVVSDYKSKVAFNASALQTSGSIGWSYPSVWASANIFTNMYNADLIARRMFAFCIPKTVQSSGFLEIGSIEPLVSPDWIPLGKSNALGHSGFYYWSSLIQDIRFNGQSIACRGALSPCRFFVDTAGGNLIVPNFLPLDVNPDCSNIDTFSDLEFLINGITYTLTSQDYIFRNTTGQCVNSIISSPSSLAPIVLGYTWLRTFYSIFDIDQNRFAFLNRTSSLYCQ